MSEEICAKLLTVPFAETTLRTPPMIVRYVKPKFLHEVIPAEKGFKKSIFQMLKFW